MLEMTDNEFLRLILNIPTQYSNISEIPKDSILSRKEWGKLLGVNILNETILPAYGAYGNEFDGRNGRLTVYDLLENKRLEPLKKMAIEMGWWSGHDNFCNAWDRAFFRNDFNNKSKPKHYPISQLNSKMISEVLDEIFVKKSDVVAYQQQQNLSDKNEDIHSMDYDSYIKKSRTEGKSDPEIAYNLHYVYRIEYSVLYRAMGLLKEGIHITNNAITQRGKRLCGKWEKSLKKAIQ